MFDKERATRELQEHCRKVGVSLEEITNENLWHWMLLTHNGQDNIPEHDPCIGVNIFYANPWETPWGENIAPEQVPRSNRILICSSNIGFDKMGIDRSAPSLTPKLRGLCDTHSIPGAVAIELSRVIGQFWHRFYGCKILFSEEPMSIPCIIITDGEMRHYGPEGMYWDARERLGAVATTFHVPIEFV